MDKIDGRVAGISTVGMLWLLVYAAACLILFVLFKSHTIT